MYGRSILVYLSPDNSPACNRNLHNRFFAEQPHASDPCHLLNPKIHIRVPDRGCHAILHPIVRHAAQKLPEYIISPYACTRITCRSRSMQRWIIRGHTWICAHLVPIYASFSRHSRRIHVVSRRITMRCHWSLRLINVFRPLWKLLRKLW